MNLRQEYTYLIFLVDIMCNVAGVLIQFACLALIINGQGQSPTPTPRAAAKPIDFPLSYLPVKKISVTVALRHGQFYRLPGVELVEQVTAKSARGEVVDWLEIEKAGVHARIELTDTALGFRFKYNLLPVGGVPVNAPTKIQEALDQLVRDFPPDHYFVTLHVWPEDFQAFRDVREYLHEKKMEVGWQPRVDLPTPDSWDITLAVGEYSEGFTSIKAQ